MINKFYSAVKDQSMKCWNINCYTPVIRKPGYFEVLAELNSDFFLQGPLAIFSTQYLWCKNFQEVLICGMSEQFYYLYYFCWLWKEGVYDHCKSKIYKYRKI